MDFSFGFPVPEDKNEWLAAVILLVVVLGLITCM